MKSMMMKAHPETTLLRRVLLAAMVVLGLSACSHWPRVKILGEDAYLGLGTSPSGRVERP